MLFFEDWIFISNLPFSRGNNEATPFQTEFYEKAITQLCQPARIIRVLVSTLINLRWITCRLFTNCQKIIWIFLNLWNWNFSLLELLLEVAVTSTLFFSRGILQTSFTEEIYIVEILRLIFHMEIRFIKTWLSGICWCSWNSIRKHFQCYLVKLDDMMSLLYSESEITKVKIFQHSSDFTTDELGCDSRVM